MHEAAAAAPVPTPEEMHEQLTRAREEAQNNLDGWRRAKADYLNLKKDVEKEKIELAKFANLSLVLELLVLADHFDRAMRHLPGDIAEHEWVKGIQAIQQQLKTLFTTLGVAEVTAIGSFNPELHEAIAEVEQKGAASGTIVEVIQTGYTLHDRLLRPAKVKVAK